MTYAQIVENILNIAKSNGCKSAFFGYSDEFNDHREKDYPAIVVFPEEIKTIDSLGTPKIMTVTFQILNFSEKSNNGISDYVTLSEVEAISNNIWLALNEFSENSTEVVWGGEIIITPIIRQYNDRLTGWQYSTTLNYDNVNC
jgi:hypothetical protein